MGGSPTPLQASSTSYPGLIQIGPQRHPKTVTIFNRVNRAEEVPGQPPLVGFLFAYPRSHPGPLKNGSSRSLHIWLAEVPEGHRGRGCLVTIVNALIDLEK